MTRYEDRIEELAGEAASARETFVPPAETDEDPDERAMELLREGLGPTVWTYVEARTGGRMVRFPPEEYERMESAMNDWIELYARCYGVDLDAEFTLRKAAELLVETHNIRDTAAMLTKVPGREDRATSPEH